MVDQNSSNSRNSSVISMAIKDKQALYMSYMPFVQNGGLFVPSKKDHDIGEKLFLLVKIMDIPDPVQISGRVIWISPARALGNRPRGIGVQFLGDDSAKISNLIENKLGGSLSLTRPTHTM